MPKDYYKMAIIIYTVQLMLLAILVNSVLVEKFGFFPYPNLGDSAPILGLVIFLLTIASIFVIRNLYHYSMKIQRHKIEVLRFKHIEEQNRIYQQHRHDLHNNMTIISGLAQLGQMESLTNYLSAYLENINKSMIVLNTGLQELDVLFSAKISQARNKDIDVSFQCQTKVSCSKNKVIALTAILANSLDNAIQACEDVRIEKRLEIKILGDVLDYVFEITNTYNPEVNLQEFLRTEGLTSKKGHRRGEGVSIIRKTVKRLQGAVSYRGEEGLCRLRIELPRWMLEGGSQ